MSLDDKEQRTFDALHKAFGLPDTPENVAKSADFARRFHEYYASPRPSLAAQEFPNASQGPATVDVLKTCELRVHERSNDSLFRSAYMIGATDALELAERNAAARPPTPASGETPDHVGAVKHAATCGMDALKAMAILKAARLQDVERELADVKDQLCRYICAHGTYLMGDQAPPSATPAQQSTAPSFPAEPGWQCPGCKRCYGPGKWQCDYCVPSLKDRIRSG